MANYPRRYYPDYPGQNYSPYRTPQYPAMPTMDSGYAPNRPAYRMEYPPVDTTPASNPSKAEAPTANQGGQVINKRYKYYGYGLLFMALAMLGLEIGNVAFTYNTFQPGSTTYIKKAFAAPYILTWIAPGIWGAIPVLITGYLAVRVAGQINKLVRIFALFCSLSATVFTPAIIAVSVAELIMYANSIPTGDVKPIFNGAQCYSFSAAVSLSCPKFILPLVVAVLAGVAFYLTMMVTIIFCCCWDQKQADSAAAEPTETTQVIDEYYPYARNPPYSSPSMMRPSPYQPYQEPIYRPAPRMMQPNMDFLSGYPAYRQAGSRGFGFAPAYNRQSYQSYGGPGGGYFPGTLPSLTNFGGSEQPNPAYRVVYG